MQQYETIQQHIDRAEIQRAVYLAELGSTAILATWKGIRRAADALLTVARAKPRNNVFTFDA